MSEYNLTPALRRIVRELVQAATAAETDEFTFTASFGFTGADFHGDPPQTVKLEPAHLNVLITERLISFTKDSGPLFSGSGMVMPNAFAAIKNSFILPDPPPLTVSQHFQNVDTGGGAFQVAVGSGNTQTQSSSIGENSAAVSQFVALTAELIGCMRLLLPADQAEAASRDAQELATELQKATPDSITVEGKARSVWQRIGTGFNATGDFAERAGKIAETATKFGPWLLAAWAAAEDRIKGP